MPVKLKTGIYDMKTAHFCPNCDVPWIALDNFGVNKTLKTRKNIHNNFQSVICDYCGTEEFYLQQFYGELCAIMADYLVYETESSKITLLSCSSRRIAAAALSMMNFLWSEEYLRKTALLLQEHQAPWEGFALLTDVVKDDRVRSLMVPMMKASIGEGNSFFGENDADFVKVAINNVINTASRHTSTKISYAIYEHLWETGEKRKDIFDELFDLHFFEKLYFKQRGLLT